MALSSDLISQFVQITQEKKQNKETTVYGTVVEYNGGKYVKLDGSDLLTPISTTADALAGERVTVMIKDHSALVTGNISSPSARTDTVKEIDNNVKELGTKISEFEIIIADKVSTERLEAEIARIDTLVSENVTIKNRLDANEASINTLTADNATINGKLTAAQADIEELKTKKLDAEIANITYATIKNLEATEAHINSLEATYGEFKDLTTDRLNAAEASIKDLNVNKLNVSDAEIKYANIDFANIDMAAVEKLFTESGIIKNLVVSDGQITGELVGVTIKGDLIEGGTVVADKLVVKGSDGLYYKLNTDGSTVETEQTEYNSLNGSVITAKSITATKISVDDLVAFGATIGGFNITETAIYSGVKSSVDNTTRGTYLDKEGQLAIGDTNNFLKYYKDADGNYKLEVSAQSIKFSSSNTNLETALGETITKSIEEFSQSTSPITLTGGSWSTNQPTWTEGTYIWRRTAITYGDGHSEYTPSADGVCITGNTGADGKGIKSEEIRYQISESGDTPPIPTDTWLESIPETTPEKPYLWTRTVIRYTDDTISTSYSVSSTLNGIDIGGRNLISEYNFTLISSSDTETSVTSKTFVINSGDADTITIAVNAAYDEGDTSTKTGAFTVSVYNVGTDGNVGEILVPEVNLSIDGERHSCIMNVSEKTRNILAVKISMSDADISTAGIIINFSNLKIEKGNQATDWTPSPEDTEDAISEIRSTMSSQKTEILSSCESIILSALETYVESGEYDEFKQTVSSQLEVLANQITMTFSTVSQQVNDVDGDLQTKFNELYKYITFSGENAITIGSSDSAIKLIIDNDQILFTKDDVTFGSWDGNNFHTGNIIVDVNERAQFGNFAFLPNTDGSLSFVKVGD